MRANGLQSRGGLQSKQTHGHMNFSGEVPTSLCNIMEADVTKNQLPGGLATVPVNLHPPSTQPQVLDNHGWKTMDSSDSQDTINHIQEMLEQLSSRGVQSILVTVGPFGEIGLNGSQKGQIFLKENGDVGDRFAKMCTELIEISADRQEHLDEDIIDIEHYKGHEKVDLVEHKDDSIDTEKKDDVKILKHFPKPDKETLFTEANDKNSNAVEFLGCPENVEERSKGVEMDASDILDTVDAIAEAESDDLKSENEGANRIRYSKKPAKKRKQFTAVTDDKNKVTKILVDVNGLFVCERCKQPFKTTAAHNKHFRSRICFIRESYDTPKSCFECSKCSCTFIRKDYLDTHEVLHYDHAPYNFRLEFVEVSDLIDQIEAMKDNEDFRCSICSNKFISKKFLLHHIILTHGKHYLCKICNQKCNSKSGCKAHTRSHEKSATDVSSEENVYQCKTCQKCFRSQATLDRHDLTMHAEGEIQSYACDQCKKIFSSEHFLAKHKETVHFKQFICSHNNCRKCFPSKKKLNSHMQSHVDRNFMCNICGRMFNSKSNFLKHLSIHDTERKHECGVCNKTFKTKDVLSKHKRIHSETRQFCCDICGWGFNQSGTLKKHMDSHYNIKRYECEICLKKFTNKSSLQNHRLQNNHFSANEQTRENLNNSIKCEHCDKLFPPGSLYMYKRHVVIHTGDRPYKCDICSKSFNDRSNLKNHKLIHSESKPFSCSVCDRGFVQKRGLTKHLQSSHNCSKSYGKDSDIFIDTDCTSTTCTLPVYETSGSISDINQSIPNVIVYSSSQDPSFIRQLNLPFQEAYPAIEQYTTADGSLKSENVVPNLNTGLSTENI
ncbi:hypothetical protein ACF0H5_001471 [Mactra antiquata]